MKIPRPLDNTLAWLNAAEPLAIAFNPDASAEYLDHVRADVSRAKRLARRAVAERLIRCPADYIARRVVNRDVHVSASFVSALRTVCKRLQEGARQKMSRAERRWLVYSVCVCHAVNLATYMRVMRGV